MTHIGLNCFSPEMNESHNYKFELANRDTFVLSQKKRPALITNTFGENRKYYTLFNILRWKLETVIININIQLILPS